MDRVNCQGNELTPAQLDGCAEASLSFHKQCVKAFGVYDLDRCRVNIHRPGWIAIVARLELGPVAKLLLLLVGVNCCRLDILDQI